MRLCVPGDELRGRALGKHAIALVDALAGAPRGGGVRVLNICANRAGDGLARALAALLRVDNAALRELSCDGNRRVLFLFLLLFFFSSFLLRF